MVIQHGICSNKVSSRSPLPLLGRRIWWQGPGIRLHARNNRKFGDGRIYGD